MGNSMNEADGKGRHKLSSHSKLFMVCECSGVCGFNEFMKKRLINERFSDLSKQQIGRAV